MRIPSLGWFAASMLCTACLSKPNLLWQLETDGESESGQSTSGATGTTASTGSGPTDTAASVTSAGVTTDPSAGSGTATTDGDPARCDGTLIGEVTFETLPPEQGPVWGVDADPNTSPSIENEQVHMSLVNDGDMNVGWGLTADITGTPVGEVSLEIVEPPPQGEPVEIYLEIGDEQWVYFIVVRDGSLRAGQIEPDGDVVDFDDVAFDPIAHAWLRITFETDMGLYVFETADQVGNWQEFAATNGELLDPVGAYASFAFFSDDAFNGDAGAVDNLALCGA